MPSPGRITRLVAAGRARRAASSAGSRRASRSSVHYDPLLAKLITSGATRDEAIARMGAALDRFVVGGREDRDPVPSSASCRAPPSGPARCTRRWSSRAPSAEAPRSGPYAMETSLTETRIRAMTGAGLWRNESLETYLDRWATRAARQDRHRRRARPRTPRRQLARAVERVAHGLRAHGVEPGSAISCQLPNWNELILLFLAARRLGAVVNPIPPTYRASELRFMLNLLESQVVVIPEVFRGFSHADMLAALRPELPSVEHVFVARGAPGPRACCPGACSPITAWEARAGSAGASGHATRTRVHEVVFTSGHDGRAEGRDAHARTPRCPPSTPAIERLGFSERDVILMASTLGHQTGYLYGYCLNLLLGATAVWLDIWNAEEAARLIEAERVTVHHGRHAVPAGPDLRVDRARPVARSGSSSRRARPIPRPLVRDARARLGCAISAGWGMTENGLATCNGLADPEEKVVRHRRRSRCPAWTCASSTTTAAPSPPGARAISLVRGARPVRRVLQAPAVHRATAHTADGWFKTGDRATLDRRGLPRHHRAVEGRHHPRRREHPGRGGREPALHSSEDRRRRRSSPCPTRGCRSAPARS